MARQLVSKEDRPVEADLTTDLVMDKANNEEAVEEDTSAAVTDKGWIQANNPNVNFTKIMLNDKALLKGFRVRKWIGQFLHQLIGTYN